ncbi:RHS repeat domain-containing protein [Brevibacillus laterosporus]|uniref:RHS repeat domain-containing protein n=1 Tax=Brevibacillus laterosporus TaxID=1465 RepID=UPI001EF17064|nr:RHS repeat-associated core domain-containing protein [Brevibacillus laterosporus]MCG7317766.1 RHS repeat-associated core domain-containing protein [Brevibacillus laterosporus]
MNQSASTFGYDKLDRIRKEKTPTREQTYTYDERGNRQSIVTAKSPTIADSSYTYDVLNRLKTYTKNGKESTYTYYPGELRASKEIDGKTTHYVYLNGNVIEELDEKNNLQARNIWGNVENKQETMSNPFLYAGEIYDEELGLIYLRARYYDPNDGWFITEDTYKGQVDNPLSLKRYTYVHNNPLSNVDPTGNWSTQITANWTLNEYKNKWANATTIAERKDAEQGAKMLRDRMRKAGISEKDIMQGSDAMIPETRVMMIAKIETLLKIENDPLRFKIIHRHILMEGIGGQRI